jgi:hypothetical protein
MILCLAEGVIEPIEKYLYEATLKSAPLICSCRRNLSLDRSGSRGGVVTELVDEMSRLSGLVSQVKVLNLDGLLVGKIGRASRRNHSSIIEPFS